jgi:hypothetical protein
VCGIASSKSCFECEQQFCVNHIYSCADCGNQYCGACFDAHHADGHWSDSDTAFELAASRRVVRASSINPLDLRRSSLAVSNQHRQSWSAVPATLKSLLSLFSQHLTHLTTLIDFMFQKIAFQLEAGL